MASEPKLLKMDGVSGQQHGAVLRHPVLVLPLPKICSARGRLLARLRLLQSFEPWAAGLLARGQKDEKFSSHSSSSKVQEQHPVPVISLAFIKVRGSPFGVSALATEKRLLPAELRKGRDLLF